MLQWPWATVVLYIYGTTRRCGRSRIRWCSQNTQSPWLYFEWAWARYVFTGHPSFLFISSPAVFMNRSPRSFRAGWVRWSERGSRSTVRKLLLQSTGKQKTHNIMPDIKPTSLDRRDNRKRGISQRKDSETPNLLPFMRRLLGKTGRGMGVTQPKDL